MNKLCKFLTLTSVLTGLLSVLLLAGCGSKPTHAPHELFPSMSATRLFKAGEHSMLRKDYEQATKYFETLDSRFPFDKHHEQTLLNLIYSYYKSGDKASAVAAADRFIHLHPRSTRVAYAYYMRGVANFEQDRGSFSSLFYLDPADRDPSFARKAFDNFNVLLRRFPHSIYAHDAGQRMVYLRDILARYDMHVANYYMRRQAYVAAANRASYVVEHYQYSPKTVNALAVMVKAYRELGLNARANEALHVLQLNYPNSKQYRALTSSHLDYHQHKFYTRTSS